MSNHARHKSQAKAEQRTCTKSLKEAEAVPDWPPAP
jgi:hypothetical protein